MASPREENVYMAKLFEQAERYEETVEFMEKVVGAVDSDELSVEERNLLSVEHSSSFASPWGCSLKKFSPQFDFNNS